MTHGEKWSWLQGWGKGHLAIHMLNIREHRHMSVQVLEHFKPPIMRGQGFETMHDSSKHTHRVYTVCGLLNPSAKQHKNITTPTKSPLLLRH